MTDVFYFIGDFFQWLFEVVSPVGNIPNVIFIIIMFIALIYWLIQLNKI